MHYLYILFSEKINRFYVGETNDVEFRIKLHNDHHFKSSFTNAANDWKVALKFETACKEEALYLEKFLKRMKSKKFIEKVIEEPSILQDLLKKR
ncbi:GIY-YIG nuclease family protein [Gramella sp. GC03-9]|uniref:GIY-YIG nuclease family protein n=1 Tax=Christiangramia oceanisediminis TaxID=2920386 RepID=A0A9X2I5A4_9FLAO|nr:GIY-YIG nuclease family protein [Gramella oceanisediminis]MCP9199652.1 GIY-YIG nuclease family protein [Gramella oceanisediminis]